MAAQRSGSFSRRCGDRNHSWTRNNEEGISRRRDRMTIDSEDSAGIFSKEDSGKQSGKTKGRRDATVRRKWNQGGEETMESEKNRRDKKRHIYRLPSPMSRASNRTGERRRLPRAPAESHSCWVASKSFYHPTEFPRAFAASESLIFRPFLKKATTASVCDSVGFAGGRICTSRRAGATETVETMIDSFATKFYSRI